MAMPSTSIWKTITEDKFDDQEAPEARLAMIFVPFGLPRLSRVVAPQNARVSLPDRGEAKVLPCTRFYAS
jgi:hypothetical protein